MARKSSFFTSHPRVAFVVICLTLTLVTDVLVTNLLTVTGIYNPAMYTQWGFRTANPVYHHDLKSNISGLLTTWGPITYSVNTNSLGFRDAQARLIEPRSSKKRLLLIGDSFTEGVGLNYDKTFSGIIASSLQATGYEVLNAGVVSYSPIIYLAKVRYLIEEKKLEFDHLAVFIDISDIQDDGTIYSRNQEGRIVSKSARVWKNNILRVIEENTVILKSGVGLVRSIREVLVAATREDPHSKSDSSSPINIPRSDWTINDKTFAAFGAHGLETAARNMTELSLLLKSKNIRLTIAVYPWPDQIYHNDLDSKQVRFWKNWAEKHNSGFINYFPDFIPATNRLGSIKKNFIPGDFHWNENGHKIIAAGFLKYHASNTSGE